MSVFWPISIYTWVSVGGCIKMHVSIRSLAGITPTCNAVSVTGPSPFLPPEVFFSGWKWRQRHSNAQSPINREGRNSLTFYSVTIDFNTAQWPSQFSWESWQQCTHLEHEIIMASSWDVRNILVAWGLTLDEQQPWMNCTQNGCLITDILQKQNCQEIIIIKSVFHSITFNWCGLCDSWPSWGTCLRKVQNRLLFSLIGYDQGLGLVRP